ncbi:MAG: adenylate/guanylate cyclase domain-containing protein [Proteobacteria bacterium]|nr:MAG: adenylate/guanylate cyclase domain-containing protein [Pseudomonadota bacterium]
MNDAHTPPPALTENEPVSLVIIDRICEWLVDQALAEPELDELVAGCSERLYAAGIPLARVMLGYSTLHPLYRSRTLYWTPDGAIERVGHTYDSVESNGWLRSPLRYMIEHRVFMLRRRLTGRHAMLDFPILEELRDQGITDYFAYLVSFLGDDIGDTPSGLLGSWSTDDPNGFSDAHLSALNRIQRLLAVATKVRVKNEIAEKVLGAYLGAGAGHRVLQGRIRLGDGERIHAVVWYSDLRESTRLAASIGHEGFLALLNDYFECTAGAVLRNGGEVLRFVGDAVLAIFPIADDGDIEAAGGKALAAAREALRLGAELRNSSRPVVFGIGLHIGDVLFGNIGVPSRLEFSVVGPCANEAARVEDLTKALKRPVLISAALAAELPDANLVDLGTHRVKGVAEPIGVFGLEDSASSPDC